MQAHESDEALTDTATPPTNLAATIPPRAPGSDLAATMPPRAPASKVAAEITSGERVITRSGRRGVVIDHQPGRAHLRVLYDDGKTGYPEKRNVRREEATHDHTQTNETAARPAGPARTDDAAVAPEHRPPGALGAEFAPQTAAQTAPATDDLADFRAYFTQHPEDLATVAEQTRAEHRADHAAIADQVNLDAVHRLAVQMALEQGLPVRPEVLADYPDLAPATLNEGETSCH